MMKERLAGPTAWIAGSNPCLAAAAASAARATHRHIERDYEAASRFTRREPQLRRQKIGSGGLIEKRLADPLDDLVETGEVDGDFVREAVLRYIRRADGVPDDGQGVVTKGLGHSELAKR